MNSTNGSLPFLCIKRRGTVNPGGYLVLLHLFRSLCFSGEFILGLSLLLHMRAGGLYKICNSIYHRPITSLLKPTVLWDFKNTKHFCCNFVICTLGSRHFYFQCAIQIFIVAYTKADSQREILNLVLKWIYLYSFVPFYCRFLRFHTLVVQVSEVMGQHFYQIFSILRSRPI